jgi:hypothetical protein
MRLRSVIVPASVWPTASPLNRPRGRLVHGPSHRLTGYRIGPPMRSVPGVHLVENAAQIDLARRLRGCAPS